MGHGQRFGKSPSLDLTTIPRDLVLKGLLVCWWWDFISRITSQSTHNHINHEFYYIMVIYRDFHSWSWFKNSENNWHPIFSKDLPRNQGGPGRPPRIRKNRSRWRESGRPPAPLRGWSDLLAARHGTGERLGERLDLGGSNWGVEVDEILFGTIVGIGTIVGMCMYVYIYIHVDGYHMVSW